MLLSVGMAGNVFAESTHVIKIPTGASDQHAPFFWSEQTTGITTGEVTVYPNDYVRWENADTAFHTITSVNKAGEVDGLFDSGLFTTGKSYSYQFTELGDFYYFCSLHPWMNGVVHVVKNPGHVQSIHNVASGLNPTGVGYDVKYVLDTSLENTVKIDSSAKTLTFQISGDTQNEQIEITLPTELIENPSTVWVDGVQTDFSTASTPDGAKITVPISPHSKEIKVMGTHVVPEFGFLAMGVLSIGVLSTVLLVRSKFSRS